MSNELFDTYENSVMPHGKNMFRIASDMAMGKYVHIHHQNMHYHIGNVFCIVVHNVQVLTSQVQNNMRVIQMLVLQYVFMCIT